MSAPLHEVDSNKCRGDGLCVEICVKGVLEIAEGKARTKDGRAGFCIHCSQCEAVCPNEALRFLEAPGTELRPKGKWKFDHAEFLECLDARRSIRNFADKPVDRALLDKILEATAAAPPGFPPTPTEVVVIDSKTEIEYLAKALRTGYAKLIKAWDNPFGRGVIRLKRGAEMMVALRSHVIPILREDNAWFERNGMDRYLYSAPVVLLFHANRWKAGHQESALVAATYAMLSAHVLGLGATMLSIVPPLFNNMGEELRPHFGIPEDNRVAIVLVLGHPKYKFRRSVRRSLKSVHYMPAK